MTEHRTIPFGLDYEDPQPVSLDIAAIERAGARLRTRRRIVGTATAAALAVAIATGVTALRPGTGPAEPATGTGLQSVAPFLAQNPPVGEPVVVSDWPPRWTTVAWATADGRFCQAAFRTPTADTSPQLTCDDIDADLNSYGVTGTGTGVGLPLPAMAPSERQQTYNRPGNAPPLYPFVGVVRGDIARVAVTSSGQTVTADTSPLTTRDGVAIGVFQIWITWPNGSWNAEDIQGVVAYGRNGAVVSRQGPWVAPTKSAS